MNFLITRYQYVFFAFIALVVLGCGNQADEKRTYSPDFVHENVTPDVFEIGIGYIKENANKDKPFF